MKNNAKTLSIFEKIEKRRSLMHKISYDTTVSIIFYYRGNLL